MSNRTDIDQFATALRETGTFVYQNNHNLAVISVAWFIGSVPIVTLGPATLAAYVAIDGLDSDRNRIELRTVKRIVREQFVPAVLFGLVPPLFFALSGLYLFVQAADPSVLTTGIFLLLLYLAVYMTLVMIPTFRGLAAGARPTRALLGGVRWTATHPTLAMLAGIVTLGVFVGTLVLMIGFVLLYPMLAFSFQTKLINLDHDESTG